MKKRGDLLAILILVAVWGMVVALVGLGDDFALNDDWAYVYSARHLLATGQLRILDWAAPSLGTHALWGAAVLWLFGDSHVALRCGTLVWALSTLLSLYGLARTTFAPRTAVLVPLALAVCPWFVNLSFTYMTDVPWLALIVAALLAFVHALHPSSSDPPRPALLLLSGALLGAAATTRQIAIITAPAFALALAFDARRRSGARWLWPAARSCLYFGLAAGAIFLPFYHWYTHVHGATQANRETIEKIATVRPWFSALLAMSVLHYAGLCLFPLALALALQRRLGEAVTRRQALWGLALLGGWALGRPLLGPVLDRAGVIDFDHPGVAYHRMMPYLGNIVYLIGIGPLTITDFYLDAKARAPHPGIWLGCVLTAASTAGGVVGAGFLVKCLQRIRRAWSVGVVGEREGAGHRRDVLRVLLLSFAGAYLLFQLCTSNLMFDRYLLPLVPMVFWLGLDATPPDLSYASVVACLFVCGIFSVAGTHEYLSWNAARDAAVRALHARGIPASDIDGGFEVNGPAHFEAYRRATGKLMGEHDFWVENARYRISLWPSRHPGCTTQERYPYWTWPGGGDRALYVLQCSPTVATVQPGSADSPSGSAER